MTHWRCGLLDPPWTERGGGKIKRGADRHYPLVPTKELPGVIVRSGLWLPERDAHLWMWTTNNYLPDALWLGAELGFTYKTNAVWVKTHSIASIREKLLSPWRDYGAAELFEATLECMRLQIGLGQYLRGAHELLLFFVRGKGQHKGVWNGHRDVRSVIRARRTKHSVKPIESYELIERVSRGPRVEFFARSGRLGWTSWGSEAPT